MTESCCRFCLKLFTESEKRIEIYDDIKSDYFDVTQTELKIISNYNTTCEICYNALRLLCVFKNQIMENQKLLIQSEIEESIEECIQEEPIQECILEPLNEDILNYSNEEPSANILNDIKAEFSYFEGSSSSTSDKIYECSICYKTFKNKNSQKVHTMLHERSAQRVIEKCDFCGKEFKGRGGLKTHIKQKHSEPIFKCDICNKSIFDRGGLQYHMLSNHLKQRNYRCTECPKAYFKNSDLFRHISRSHSKKQFICTFPACENSTFWREDKCRAHIYESHPNHKIDDLIKIVGIEKKARKPRTKKEKLSE